VNVPIVAVSFVAATAIVHESADRRGRTLDVRGVASGAALLAAITFAFIEAGRDGAGSPTVIAAVVCALLLAALFLVVERRRGAAAMLPLGLFRRRGASRSPTPPRRR